MKRTLTDPGLIRVEFEKRYDASTSWDDEDNVSPYIFMKNPEEDILAQRAPNHIVILMQSIRVLYTYPLKNDVIFEFKADTSSGFTRAHLARQIAQGYQRIYQEEEEAVNNNNNCHTPSERPYGIWGHCIGNLVLHQVYQVNAIENLFKISVHSKIHHLVKIYTLLFNMFNKRKGEN